MILSYTVQKHDEGRKVYSVLTGQWGASTGLVRRLKRADGIKVNGESVFTDYRLHAGEVLTADVSACEPSCGVVPENGEVDVLWEDEGMLAVNKPSGLIIHPTHARYTGTLANYAAGYLLKSEGCGNLHAVNRLDRDTSGVVLFAKNSYMMARCCAALASGESEKRYLAVIFGSMEELDGTIDAPVRRKNETDMMREVGTGGQRAVTHYKTLASKHGASLLSIRLETGRTHQIRVHCLFAGHPILGDGLYFTQQSAELSEKLGISSQALHASKLSFVHPITGEYIEISAPAQGRGFTIF